MIYDEVNNVLRKIAGNFISSKEIDELMRLYNVAVNAEHYQSIEANSDNNAPIFDAKSANLEKTIKITISQLLLKIHEVLL